MKGWLKLTIFKKKMKDSERTNKYDCIFPTFSASRMVCTVHLCMHMVRSATAWIEHSSILCHINLHSHLLHGLQDINITIGLECITLLYTAPVPSSFSVMKSENGSWVFLLDGEFLTGSGFCLILVLLCLQKKNTIWWSIICFSPQNCSLNFCPCLKTLLNLPQFLWDMFLL